MLESLNSAVQTPPLVTRHIGRDMLMTEVQRRLQPDRNLLTILMQDDRLPVMLDAEYRLGQKNPLQRYADEFFEYEKPRIVSHTGLYRAGKNISAAQILLRSASFQNSETNSICLKVIFPK